MLNKKTSKIPIIYSDKYNFSLNGIQNSHPFDSEKYRKIFGYLIDILKIDKNRFYTPIQVRDELLLKVHTKEYLNSLNDSYNVAQIAEIRMLTNISNEILQEKILNPVRYAVGGSILGVELALKYGWSINLSGGYHHSKRSTGSGFCFFSDIAIAITVSLTNKDNSIKKIMVVDLDAHQGNGIASIFKNDPRVIIFDMYNKNNYPFDIENRKYIDYNIPLEQKIQDKEYISFLTENLEKAINEIKPDFVIYNAGTDIFKEDPLGGLAITEKGIIQRDEIVFKTFRKKNIPIEMVLSGGYTSKSWNIVGKSIVNLISKKIITIIS